MIEWLLFPLGVLILGIGAQLAVNRAAKLARGLGVDRYGVGAIVIATITSFPELAVASVAMMQGKASMAIGAAFGSTLGLVLLSLGILGMITRVRFNTLRKKEILWATIIITWVTVVAVSAKTIGWVAGAALVGAYFAYMRLVGEGGVVGSPKGGNLRDAFAIIVGVALVVIGAGMVVEGGVNIAEAFNVPEFFVALFVVGLGANLPEMAINISSAIKGYPQIAVGNIMGSAVANLTLVLGTAAIIGSATGNPLVFNGTAHIIAGLVLSVAIVGAKLCRDEEISKVEASAMILLYALVVLTELLWTSG